MPLQHLTIQRINDSFGLQRIISVLDIVAKSSSVSERFYINNLIIYLRTMYIIKVDLVQDLIDFESHTRKIISILSKKYHNQKHPELKLIIELIEYNLNYTANIKKIG